MIDLSSTRQRWFSENPDRAWAEKFFLIYIPCWIIIMAVFTAAFPPNTFGDFGMTALSLVVGLPLLIVPALLRLGKNPNGRWYESYWFKANLFVFIVQFLGNYFISEYFFDVLGMIYNYPTLTLHADSALVGSGVQSVPLMMYGITQATYVTYHTTSIILMRRVLTTSIPVKPLFFAMLVAALAYAWSWMETMSFANSAIEGNFSYKDKEAMLKYGSIIFGMAFVPSFPLFFFLDEKASARWSLWAVVGAGLSAAMIGLLLTDFCTHLIGTI